MGLQLQASYHRSTTIKGTSCMTQGPQTLLLHNILVFYKDLVYMLMTVLCLQLIFLI